MFAEDMDRHRDTLRERIGGSRIAIVGAAGSIGFPVVKAVLQYRPAGLSLIDINENNLVEVVRDLRSSGEKTIPEDFNALPIGLGSVEFLRFFRESPPFDYILNLSAVKHVRSEKNVYVLIRMFDTNVVFLSEFLDSIPYRMRNFFSVSSDKAANPANLMGASKMLMEEMLRAQGPRFSTARFANVAFSDGSLPYAFLKRIEKSQPIAAPNDVKRFFISHREAAEICILACFLGENADAYFPALKSDVHEKSFSEIAVGVLDRFGFEAVPCDSADEAKQFVDELLPQRKWPCYFFESETSGEKPREEFYTQTENVDFSRYRNIGVVKRDPVNRDEVEKIDAFIEFAKAARNRSGLRKEDYIREIKKIVPGFEHIETGKNLDQIM